MYYCNCIDPQGNRLTSSTHNRYTDANNHAIKHASLEPGHITYVVNLGLCQIVFVTWQDEPEREATK